MLYPKKSLGQNFLRDENVLQKIIQAANLSPADLVLEIGPGEGILTEALAKKAGRVIAVEIDKNLAENLKKRFASNKKVGIINADILKINLSDLLSAYKLKASSYKLVANIPYYITSLIIRFFLENKLPPQEMILMVQKEVAERIVSKPGRMSLLSVSVQYYARPELLFYVDKKSFYPVPEVDSAVIRITPYLSPSPVLITKHPLPQAGEEDKKNKGFFRVVKAGFSAKRKTLVNNLSNSLHLEKNIVEEKIKSAGFKSAVRAQELSVEDWKKLAEII